MWHSSATSTRSTPSSPAPPEAASTEQDGQTSFRRRPPLAARSTLAEALKSDPFKTSTASPRPRTPTDDDPTVLLNNDLKVFARIYPDVKVEVLRELLLRFDGESRLHICTEQLVKYKSEWARGRLLNPPRDLEIEIPVEEMFRSKSYVAASKRTLSTEFKTLNKSVIDAVLAEVNQSYAKARPVLQGIAAKSWRATFSSFFKRRKGLDEIPPFLVEKHTTTLTLQHTSDHELDQELESLFLTGPRRQRQYEQQQVDKNLAILLNQQEAEEAGALFECQVCYNDVPFEFMVSCTGDAHTICRDCVKRLLNEAIFGQGWSQSVDTRYGTLRCVASDAHDACTGHVPLYLLRATILAAEAGRETWNKFEQRLATDNIMRSGVPLIQCPFCHYAEAQQLYTPSTTRSIKWRIRKQQPSMSLVLLLLLAEFSLPTLLLLVLAISILSPGLPRRVFNTSLINLHRHAQTQRFHCRNLACSRTSCLSCSKRWHDPHVCHEPLILSLRTAVEAARTAALKRTCPRCSTSFIKSSGCNKLTCVCGYAMCYLCRKNIGKVNDAGAVDDREGGEGYRHFCEHFRPMPGQKCTECNKCDLYMSENEEMLVKRAGEEAEKEWREREGMVGVRGLGLEEAVGSLVKLTRNDTFADVWNKFVTGDWTVQSVCDWVMGKLIVVEN